jgi:leucyl aminopeptidase (aminopeptidase T)
MGPEEPGAADVARALLGRALRLKRGENLIVETWNHTLPYAAACVVEARRIGAHPMLLLEDEQAYWRSLDVAPAIAGWAAVGRHEWAALAKANGYVFFPGPADRPRFRTLPAAKASALTIYNAEWLRRARATRLRGVRSVLGYASEPQAEFWGLSGMAWRQNLARGTVEADYPAIVRAAQRASRLLARGRELRITASNGTDVKMRIRGRPPWVDDGVVTPEDLAAGRNLAVSPPGAVIVAVDERSAEGVFIASRPSFLRGGRVEGGQWEMRAGHLTNYWYTEGQETFDAQYKPAGKGRDVVSLFSIGLNEALVAGVPQVEDQEAGAVTIAVGGNQSYGGSNRCPFVSWVVVGEATVAVDGTPLCDRGHLM